MAIGVALIVAFTDVIITIIILIATIIPITIIIAITRPCGRI